MTRARTSEWPGANRRHPAITDPAWLAMRPLSERIEAAVGKRVRPRGDGLAVLDVGCGVKPFRPFFAPVASEYVGLDIQRGPQVDVVASAEELPFDDERFDVVFCSQVLEHVGDPPSAVREAHRVLKPGGLALFSTHGTAPYHPGPTDFWRWTQEGLERLFRDNGEWDELELEEAGGTVACFGRLFCFYLEPVFDRLRLTLLGNVVMAAINLAFGALDRVVPLHYPRPYTLSINFLVTAQKPAAIP